MVDIRMPRGTPLGYTDPAVVEAAYKLTKAKSEQDARMVMQNIAASIYPALQKHMLEHRNLFSPEVLAAIAGGPAAPTMWTAEALFS